MAAVAGLIAAGPIVSSLADLLKKPILLITAVIVGVIVFLVFPGFAMGCLFSLGAYFGIWLLNGFHKWGPLPCLAAIAVAFLVGFASQSFSIISFDIVSPLDVTTPAIAGSIKTVTVMAVLLLFIIPGVILLTRKERK